MLEKLSNLPFVNQLPRAPTTSEEVDETINVKKNLLKGLISTGDKNERLKTVLSELKRGQPEVFERLATESLDYEGRTLFHLAAEKGDAEIVDVLRTFYPKAVNTPDKSHNTPLMYAAKKNNVAVIDLLLKANAAANAKNDSGWTALMWAAFSGAVSAVKTLLGYESGSAEAIDINEVNDRGRTAYHVALASGHVEAAQSLKNAGADTNIKDGGDNTAFMMVAGDGRLRDDVMELLKPTAEDMTQKNSLGLDIWRCAIGNRNLEDRAHNVKILLTCDADPNAKLRNDETPLMFAITKKDHNVVSILTNASNINLESKDILGRTALMRTMMLSKPDPGTSLQLAKSLIEAGADYDAKDNGGNSVRDFAESEGLLEDLDKFIEQYKSNKAPSRF